MKKITNLTKQVIFLEGFGALEISEDKDGVWLIDFFPRGYENNEDALKIETVMKNYGDKYIQSVKTIRKKLNATEEMNNI
jgi:hypothetical protein